MLKDMFKFQYVKPVDDNYIPLRCNICRWGMSIRTSKLLPPGTNLVKFICNPCRKKNQITQYYEYLDKYKSTLLLSEYLHL